MKRISFLLTLLLALYATGPALAEAPPATAKKATLDEFKALADGKKVDVVIYDLEVPVTATLVWNWKKKQITGNALLDGKKKIKVKAKLSFDGEKACSSSGEKPTCHLIYIDGDRFYEVRDDGHVHATSTLEK